MGEKCENTQSKCADEMRGTHASRGFQVVISEIKILICFEGLRRSHGEGHGNPLQYSCLENPMDRGARQATVHGVAKSRTRLSDYHFHFSPPKIVSQGESIMERFIHLVSF